MAATAPGDDCTESMSSCMANCELESAMAKQRVPLQVQHSFSFTNDAELNRQIADFRREHERSHGQVLAMQARRELGAGKVMVTFRVVEKAR